MAYFLIVALTMLVLPVGSILIDAALHPAQVFWLIGKWFVFWGVGARLLIAGARQYVQPQFTSREIMGVENPAAHVLVRELGGANIASGVVGLMSLALPNFVLPSALAAGIFYAVAGIEHVKSPQRNRNERLALASDLFIAAVLLGFSAVALLRGAG